ncbi:hypothetical protein [Bacillus sp. T33-2]|uniref:hypothetical protein n=1 Tax=Bacillus sp. T33-2 TaxID=2054168 RepID=UPI0035B4FCE8
MKNRLKSEKTHRMDERYQAIRLHPMGKSDQELAAILQRTSKTIGNYIHSYLPRGKKIRERRN